MVIIIHTLLILWIYLGGLVLHIILNLNSYLCRSFCATALFVLTLTLRVCQSWC